MKKVLLLILMLSSAFTTSDETLQLFRVVNYYRNKAGNGQLLYQTKNQYLVDERARQISRNFELSEDCVCDGESIARSTTYQGLFLELTDSGVHLEKQARYGSVSIHKPDSVYYAVIWVFNR